MRERQYVHGPPLEFVDGRIKGPGDIHGTRVSIDRGPRLRKFEDATNRTVNRLREPLGGRGRGMEIIDSLTQVVFRFRFESDVTRHLPVGTSAPALLATESQHFHPLLAADCAHEPRPTTPG